jgi:hypothetical protein
LTIIASVLAPTGGFAFCGYCTNTQSCNKLHFDQLGVSQTATVQQFGGANQATVLQQ